MNPIRLFILSCAIGLLTEARAATLYEVGMSEKFKVFEILAEASDTTGFLISGDSYTVFAPENSAFGKVTKALLSEMWIPEEHWAQTFWHHVVRGSYPPEKLKSLSSLRPLAGEPLRIRRSSSGLTVNGHLILESKVVANGVVYTVDRLLIPESAAGYFE